MTKVYYQLSAASARVVSDRLSEDLEGEGDEALDDLESLAGSWRGPGEI